MCFVALHDIVPSAWLEQRNLQRWSACEKRSQTGSFVLAALIGNRDAHAPLAISILIKVFFFPSCAPRRVTASSLIANRASRARRVAIRTVYPRLSRGASLKGDWLSKCNRVTRASYSRTSLSFAIAPIFLLIRRRAQFFAHSPESRKILPPSRRFARCSRRNAHARVCPLERASVAADARPRVSPIRVKRETRKLAL